MLRVVERNTKVKISTHFLHLWSSGGNKGYRASSFILQLPCYRCACRAGGNGTAGTAMAVPVFEAEKMASLGF